MDFITRLLRAQICVVLSFALVLSTTGSVLAQAIDVSAPKINHTVVPSGTAGDSLLIEAQVTDNVGVASVVLFYRFKGDSEFQELPMSLEGGDQYAALVPTEAGFETDLEYYIEAADAGGTKTTRGLSFDPLTVSLLPGAEEQPVEAEPVETPVVAETAPVESEAPVVPKPKSRTLWYVVGGVLLLGIAAAAAGGGGGDDDPTTGQACADAGCSVTFNVTQP